MQERGANNRLGSYNYALLLVYVTGYRILGALSKCQDIALSDSVGYDVSAVVDVSFRALNATHSAT